LDFVILKKNWYLFVITLFIAVPLSFICSNSFAQIRPKFQMGVSLMGSVIIDVESGMDIIFVEQDGELNEISVQDINEDRRAESYRQAGLIRITGAPVETMIDIEGLSLQGVDNENNTVFTIHKFNLMDKDAGANVTVMPYSDDASYLLTIGGTIEGRPHKDDVYTGVNVVNVNYL
jgi:hypothetical protein